MKKYILILILIFAFIFFILNFESKKKAEEVNKNVEENLNKNIQEEKNYLMGKFNPEKTENFILIPQAYASKNNLYLRNETYSAFLEMRESALKNNIALKIVSATRNFDSQKIIWENKWSGITLVDNKNLKETIPDELERFKKIIEFSSVPGTSRHHWGTDIDINNVDPKYFETEKGKKEYDWLVKNASEFGFCQPYNNNRNTGYDEEKWHWTYLPISKKLTEEYKNLIKLEDIKGFLGDKYVTEMNIINNYVLSINTECL